MSLLDKNKIFFGLIHYILSEQKNVNWILKTSLIDITGVSSVLEEKAYNKDSLLDDIVDYISDIKPYHVQFSKYFEHYQTARETINLADKDWIETSVHKRFDNISPTPDINSYFYNIINDINSSEYATSEYNVDGLIVYSSLNKCFYERKSKYNDITQNIEYYWEESNISLEDGNYYCEKNKILYKYKDYILKPFTQTDKDNFINSTKANRLFYLGIRDLDELKKELNANFKGIEVNGSIFDIENFGYDIFNYDTSDYDSPTIVYDYMVVDKRETFIDFASDKSFDYTKEYVDSSNHIFDIPPSFIPNTLQTIKVYSKNSLNTKYIEEKDYDISINNNSITIDFFTNIGKKTYYIFVMNKETFDINSCCVLSGNPFTENNSSEYKREFITYIPNGFMKFKSPTTFIESGKVAIQIIDIDGRRKPFMNYSIDGDNIIIDSNSIKPMEHIIMTSFDYKYLYDKIYTWEDKYGRSNNIVNLDGNNFLRAKYESDRPSELVVSYPQNNLFVYTMDDEKCNVFYNDWKNDMCKCSFENGCFPKITDIKYYDDGITIKSIIVDDITSIPETPGNILINSEIIEYNEFDKKTKTISALRRGINGSIVYSDLLNHFQPFKHTHKIGDSIYPFVDSYKSIIEKNNKYISYIIKNPKQKSYYCPTGVKNSSDIVVSKLEKIDLLEDVYYNTTDILINSCNIIDYNTQQLLLSETSTKKYTGNFFLKINDDTIPFKSINRDRIYSNIYHITDFTLPKKYQNSEKIIYKSSNSFIHSSIPIEETNFTLHHVKGSLELKIDKSNPHEWYVLINDNNDALTIVISKNTTDDSLIGTAYNDGKMFGQIIDNILYKTDGSIYAKIENDNFILIDTIITLENEMVKNETLLINVIN